MQHATRILKMRLVWGVLLGAAFLTFITLAWPGGIQGAPPTPLTLEQMRLVAEKQQARREAGITDPSSSEGMYAQPGEPVRQFVGTIKVTKAELLADLDAAWAADKEYLDQLDRDGGAKTAQPMREEYEKQRRSIEALPDGPVSLDIPSVEVGRHSISGSSFTYSGSERKDPINVVFYRVGKAWDVNYDMRNWTRLRWSGCGVCTASQRVYIWDAQHAGGWNGWRNVQYSLQREQGAFCGTPRYHLRIFGSFVRDSHSPGFGWWSVVGAHHDGWWHIVDSWENAESKVLKSFQNANGSPLWFVGVRWEANLGNAGTYSGAYNNGKARIIELLY